MGGDEFTAIKREQCTHGTDLFISNFAKLISSQVAIRQTNNAAGDTVVTEFHVRGGTIGVALEGDIVWAVNFESTAIRFTVRIVVAAVANSHDYKAFSSI
ncbi:hypothetical protein PAXRUDRAFT_834113 [Paxillus rubicundulus Ve08.2h10]|uniref:Uncharacterized protein n=1 Tax=Paxillus rubicundulus Ve08.2h10 TaxID=930991 RepID=A0A0D0C952_9AGAM|nr:hypothetical protein PAXRUDRAFT_834113 [Paxillus rubicundulus Ve08.2h10]